MATKSIAKNVNIKDRILSRNLVSALENAQNKVAKEVSMARTFSEVKGSRLKSIFGENR